VIIGPDLHTVDLSVNKLTKIAERSSLQFRAEIINAFNRAIRQEMITVLLRGVWIGYPGPITPAAQEVQSTFIIPDLFTRVARGASIDDSMKWAAGEYQRIYAKHKA
jgi:hypothetical protein